MTAFVVLVVVVMGIGYAVAAVDAWLDRAEVDR